MQRVMSVILTLLLIASSTVVMGNPNGKFNASSGCNCHGGGQQTTPTLSGLPNAYTPDATYTLTVSMTVTKVRGGFNLEVSQGDLTAAGPGVQASSNGFQATHTTPTFTTWDVNWTAPSEGSGSTRFELAVLAGNGGGTGGDAQGTMVVNVAEAEIINSPPSITGLSVLPSYPTTGDDLEADYTYADNNQDDENGSLYEWYLNGTLMSAYTERTLNSNATTRGQTWRVDVTPSDGESTGDKVVSANVTVVNSPPRVVNLTASNLNPSTNNIVSLEFTAVDDDGDEVSTALRWMLNGTHVSTLDGEDTLPAMATRDGDVWVGQVQASDNESVSGWTSTPAITVGGTNEPPVVTSVTITNGDLVASSANLTATYTSTDPEGDPVRDVAYQWLLNGSWAPEVGDGNALSASSTARGERWSVMVRVSDGSVWSAWSTSQEALVVNTAPEGSATITHANFTVVDGFSLSMNTVDIDGDDVSVVDVTWLMNNVTQPVHQGEHTLPKSVLTKGEQWSARVVFSDGQDNTTVDTPSVTITNAVPVLTITAPTEITALAPFDMTVSSSDADNDALTLVTAWYRNGFLDSTLNNATSVPSQRLAPGQTWRIEAFMSDGEASSDTVDIVRTVANLPPVAIVTLLTDDVWIGEEIRVSSVDSSDPENSRLSSIWTLNGATYTGQEVSPVIDEPGTLNLTVTDEHGASTTASMDVVPSLGPRIAQLDIAYDSASAEVDLTWAWSGPEVSFGVWRNGINIGETTGTGFSDTPPTEGLHHYSVQPFTDQRVYHAAVAESSVEASAVAVESPTSSESGGIALSAFLVTLGATALWLSWRRT